MTTDRSRVQLPGGRVVELESGTADEIIQRAIDEFSFDPTTVSVIDIEGNVIPSDQLVPKETRLVVVAPWG